MEHRRRGAEWRGQISLCTGQRPGWGGGVSQPKRIVRSGSMKNKGGNADNSTKMANIRGKR